MLASYLRKIIPERFRPIGYLTHLTQKRSFNSVMNGPFAGMRYARKSQGSAYIPKLLGIYERELVSCIESLIANSPSMVVDVGAAEGYYAVGMARRLPNAKVVAFEMELSAHDTLREMSESNGVAERVSIRGKCETSDLFKLLQDEDSVAVICDVEGYEKQLLDPSVVPQLIHSTILVELHDFLVPDITQTLIDRFNTTHKISHIWQEPRSTEDFPWRTMATSLLPQSYLDWAVSEWRPVKMSWLWMEPKKL
ncbi:hypothetical protein FEM03_14535 [Phragmitibacter flavus]|uniref:FkbM family methyltransferase n=1 Tax=Phragmitibacter flavus TaxID=2576071 RepID=A0A5R8KCB9_9BACT|nr:hypothetical protein [Phragmitibacter flavus]TLD69946.1 hypothetical protein FEM03_14535 [Phragmitibacter flavus]